jgi:multicomponent Na+:H+ antiporter subunit F
MNTLALAIALFLLANLVVALIAAARGPTPADRMLMAMLFGTTGTAVLALLAAAGDDTLLLASLASAALVDVALLLALLAAIGGIAFAKRAWHAEENEHD